MEMYVNYFRLALLASALSLTTACSIFSDDFSAEDSDKKHNKIIVPEGLAMANKSDEYKLADGSFKAKGSDNITSPSSVLEIMQGSWVNTDDPHPYKIMLEKPAQVEDFNEFVQNGVNGLVKSRGYKILKSSQDVYQIEMEKQTSTGIWFWKTDIKTERFVYDLHVKILPHGRSGEAFVEPRKLDVLNETFAPKFPIKFRMQQLAVEVLNQFSLELDYQFRVAIQKQRNLNDVSLELTTNSAGDAVISTQRESSLAFKELDDVLIDLGFNIEDEDKKLYIYSLSYDKSSKSFWQTLFGSKHVNQLNLPKGNYEVVLITNIDGVNLVFTDEDGQPLSDAQMSEIFELMLKVVNEENIEL